jgi:branched-chain amino acid transport system ATP-binding protein
VPPVEGAGTALTVSEVAVQFGGVAALANASLRVAPGSVTGLIGPNGAGKTTLFNVISGLQAPDRGTVHLFDNEVTGMHPSRRARLGLARTFQRLELFGSLTAADNVRVGIESSVHWWSRRHLRRSLPVVRRWGEGEGGSADNGAHLSIASRCELLLERVGLAGHGHEQVGAMSTGSARMVELARALAIEPKLLLLDEPGSGLDDAESQALGRLLRGLAEGGMAVLLVEHDMELVMRICEYIYVLDFGDVIAAGTPDEIRGDPVVQAAYLGAAHGDPITKGR